MRVFCSMVLGLALASGASAQPSGSNAPLAALGLHTVQPMNAEQIELKRRLVDTELAQDAAVAAFENITDATGGKVRHRTSGLICPLGEPRQRVEVVAPDNVVCWSTNGANTYRTQVLKAADGATLASLYEDQLSEARRQPNFAPFRGPAVEAHPRPGSGLPDHRTIRFMSSAEGRTLYNRLQVALVGGWALTEKMSGLPPTEAQPSMSEIMAEAMFGSKLKPVPPRAAPDISRP